MLIKCQTSWHCRGKSEPQTILSRCRSDMASSTFKFEEKIRSSATIEVSESLNVRLGFSTVSSKPWKSFAISFQISFTGRVNLSFTRRPKFKPWSKSRANFCNCLLNKKIWILSILYVNINTSGLFQIIFHVVFKTNNG